MAALTEPCDETWCMARVAALLSPYYDKGTPEGVRRMEAEDWLEALAEYPQWAIERAVRWWKSADNADRRKKPLEGDIAARCKVEMRGIGAVPGLLQRKRDGAYREDAHEKPRLSAKERQTIAEDAMVMAGYRPKPMKGAGA